MRIPGVCRSGLGTGAESCSMHSDSELVPDSNLEEAFLPHYYVPSYDSLGVHSDAYYTHALSPVVHVTQNSREF